MNHLNQVNHDIKHIFSSLLANIPHGLVTLGPTGTVSVINGRALQLLGFGENALAKDFIDLTFNHIFDLAPDISDMYERMILSGRHKQFDIASLSLGPFELMVKCRRMVHGSLVLLEDKADLNQLKYDANHDDLTHLLNRREFELRLDLAFKRHQTQTINSGVLFIDLDHFKPVNDIAGHAAGDALLRRISTIIRSRIHQGDHAARMGGDEFCVLIEDCPVHVCERVAQSICDDIEKLSFHHNGRLFTVSASIGIACMNGSFTCSSEVLSAADAACRSAKSAGRNAVQILDKGRHLYDSALSQSEWLEEVQRALSEDRFLLARQKICATENHSLHHWEILLRMRNSDGKILSPGAFLPSAERYRIMPDIDRHVLTKVFAYCHSHHEDAGYYAVNLSAQTLCQDRLPSFIDALLEKYPIDTQRVMFEITESSALDNMETCIETMNYLAGLGFHFALDDFGTGFSSFKSLQSIPVNYLKIDGSFIRGVESDKTLQAIVQSMKDIASALGLRTIAEFVENEAECDELSRIGIDLVQGYYLHKPELMSELPAEVPFLRRESNLGSLSTH